MEGSERSNIPRAALRWRMKYELSLLDHFRTRHEPNRVERMYENLAQELASPIEPSGYPEEVTTSVRKLLESRDAYVRSTHKRGQNG